MEEDIRVADSQNVNDSDIDSLKGEDGGIDVDKLKALISEKKKLAEANPKLFERAKNAEAKAKELKPTESIIHEQNDSVLKDLSELKLAESKRQFGYENGLSPNQTDKVFQLTQNNPTKDILEDDFVKAGLRALEAKKRVESNVPSGNAKTVTIKGKAFSDLSRDEKEKNFGDYMKQIASKS